MARIRSSDPQLLASARALRADSTAAERLLWSLLRNRKLGGYKFRRQHPLGAYVLDFYCADARLGVEVDGGQHYRDEHASRDEARTEMLRRRGVRVLRFSNHDVLQRTSGVLEVILATLRTPLP